MKMTSIASMLGSALLAVPGLNAAAISWSATHLTDASNVSTKGTFLEGLNFSGGTMASARDTTINGVTFAGLVNGGESISALANPSATYYSSDTTRVVPADEDKYDSPPGLTAYETLLEGWLWGPTPSGNTVTLTGLTDGQSYEVQLFFGATNGLGNPLGDNRYIIIDRLGSNPFGSATTTNFGADEINSPEDPEANPAGVVITGTFTADGTSQSFTIDNIRNGAPPGSPFFLNGYQLRALPSAPFEFVVARNGANYDFSWDSKEDKIYDLLSNTTLGTDPSTWPAYDDGMTVYEDIKGNDTGKNTLTDIPGSGPERFFVVLEKEIPPLLFADFEGSDDGFTVVTTTGSAWERGTPSSSGFGGEVSEGADGSATCWGTNIGNPGFFLDPTTTSLRSPVIDLSNVTSAELTFAEALDIEAADSAVVNIIDDTTDTLIAGPIYTADDSGDTSAAAWMTANNETPIAIPAAAIGQAVRIEWRFQGMGGTFDDYLGWYIDNVTVTGN